MKGQPGDSDVKGNALHRGVCQSRGCDRVLQFHKAFPLRASG